MQFEIQGQNYFLKFHQGQGRWYLLKPTYNGFSGMEVLDDGAPVTGVFPIPSEDDDTESVVN